MGYSATEGAEAVAAVVQALSPASSSSSSCDRGMEDEVYALGLALRTLLVAYGEDEGTAMFEVRDRKKGGGGEQAAAELNFMRLTFLFSSHVHDIHDSRSSATRGCTGRSCMRRPRASFACMTTGCAQCVLVLPSSLVAILFSMPTNRSGWIWITTTHQPHPQQPQPQQEEATGKDAGGAGETTTTTTPLPASGAPFDPSDRGVRPRYPDWATQGGGGLPQLTARLRGVAMLMAYRCVPSVVPPVSTMPWAQEPRASLSVSPTAPATGFASPTSST